jgi:serine/threonine protein kinase
MVMTAVDRLGPYKLLGRIARSGEGRVYRGEDSHGCPVAVKVLDCASVSPAFRRATVERFVRAARLWKRLDHDAIVRLLAAGRAGDRLYVATEWIKAPTLDAVLAARGPLGATAAVAVGLRLAEALAYAHGRGVIHRDLKPANVFLGPEGARLADFGLARALGHAPGEEVTASGEALGTFAYMAPELAADARAADERTDVYGLGATLFHALSGRPPHATRSLGEAIRRMQGGAPPLPPEAAGAGGFLSAVVARAVAPRPADRYGSAAELAADLGVARALEAMA